VVLGWWCGGGSRGGSGEVVLGVVATGGDGGGNRGGIGEVVVVAVRINTKIFCLYYGAVVARMAQSV